MSADKVNEVKNKDTNQELVEDNNVDKIRDILFGGNMREYDKRFARLEDRLNAKSELSGFEKQTTNRFADVEQQTSAEARTIRSTLHEQGNELLELIRTTRDRKWLYVLIKKLKASKRRSIRMSLTNVELLSIG